MDIGEVVRRSGVPTTTLHVWEKAGLIEPSGRMGLRRQYGADVLDRIAAIVICQQGGFTLAEIAALLARGALEESRCILVAKRQALLEERVRIDRALNGIDHALECTAPTPLECPHFRSKLEGVLPVPKRRGDAAFDDT